ncbi:hypothetical protein POVCU2_0025330 [Plasmodium ovale curtisi]|uniref:Uncharacterized protein n=1 Tax=Plasmodium ovale curtisi TaxID=864141 RepID=A0A1A8X5G0_PLAOA|nr:hypothetical protein POVCU2_0025330 [Plasmodium ovale curtisi]SBS99844.1 hypothetical protein POVCU1_055500 [Plasmodium ovale curtisi]
MERHKWNDTNGEEQVERNKWERRNWSNANRGICRTSWKQKRYEGNIKLNGVYTGNYQQLCKHEKEDFFTKVHTCMRNGG